ncbi:MAG: sigma 54-interacting transcriptional regulator [Candidatus Magnetoovum sp. WYHC-5]|nr:sigma 54-interacting transcriptional regulator [Candidatus Magnetoovum sp. WYHC-5]
MSKAGAYKDILLDDLTVIYTGCDEELIDELKNLQSKQFRYIIAQNGSEGLDLFNKYVPHIVITDTLMPVMDGISMASAIKIKNPAAQIIMLFNSEELPYLTKAIDIGVDKFIRKPIDTDMLEIAIKQLMITYFQKQEINALNVELDKILEGIFGSSFVIKENMFNQIKDAFRLNFPVLIQGEEGVGKSSVAFIIHGLSDRSEKPYIVLDFKRLTETTIEAKLFGEELNTKEKAAKSVAIFEQTAGELTLVLENIDNMSLKMQGKLLKILRNKEDMLHDIKLISTCGPDLADLIQHSMFNKELISKLGQITIKIPPLRERPEDIPILVKKILNDIIRELDKDTIELNNNIMKTLVSYNWPRNFRELRGVLRNLVLLSESVYLQPEEVKYLFNNPKKMTISKKKEKSTRTAVLTLKEAEEWAIKNALMQTKGNKTKAATLLQVDFKTLLRKMKIHGI